MKELRVKITLKNNILISKREELGLSQITMAKFVLCDLATYTGFENLKCHPNDSELLMSKALQIADILESDIEELFPESLTKIKVNKKIYFVNYDECKGLSYQPTQILQIESKELKATLDKFKGELSSRENYVLDNLSSLGDGEFTSFRAMSKHLGISLERVIQIKNKALRKLKHRCRAKKLVEEAKFINLNQDSK